MKAQRKDADYIIEIGFDNVGWKRIGEVTSSNQKSAVRKFEEEERGRILQTIEGGDNPRLRAISVRDYSEGRSVIVV